MTWQDKAEELRQRGYLLEIYALSKDDDNRWLAKVAGCGGRRHAMTIEAAIEQVYEWVKTEWEGVRDIDTCKLCKKKKSINDFGEKMDFYIENDNQIIPLRHLCNDCARKIALKFISFGNEIELEIKRQEIQNQTCFCSICQHEGIYKEWITSDKITCPKCGYTKRIIAT